MPDFREYCDSCKQETLHHEYIKKSDENEIKVGTLNINGGMFAFTIRELLVKFNFRKLVLFGQCANCKNIKMKCPYCEFSSDYSKNTTEKCRKCNKIHYFEV